MGTEVRSLVAELGEMELSPKEYERTFWEDGYAPCLDFSGGYMTKSVCQNS